jgi:exodeoxyribonuclease-3
MKLLSWNVNGMRAVHKKGLLLPLLDLGYDIVCLQETKVEEPQLPVELTGNVKGYHAYFCSSEGKKGYSGTALYSKYEPISVKKGFGISRFDSEGRIIIAEYKPFVLYNIYFPNGNKGPERLNYKMEFYEEFLRHAEKNRGKGKEIIVCGDINTAHKPVDLARPKENEHVSGFLPEERAFLDRLVSAGYIDTFRSFNKNGDNYSWWDVKTAARNRNVGWRIDYFYISEGLKSMLKDAFILKDVMGSDHAPVGIELRSEF